MKKYLSVCILLLLCYSCTEETTTGRTSFPDINVVAFKFVGDQGYRFSVQKSIKGGNTIILSGDAVSDMVSLPNYKLKVDVTDYLYKTNTEIKEPNVFFQTEKIASVKIYSDQDFNSIKAGGDLTSLFSINGRFIEYKNDKYVLYENDILKHESLKDVFFPRNLSVELLSMPIVGGRYLFYLELIDGDGKVYLTQLGEVNL